MDVCMDGRLHVRMFVILRIFIYLSFAVSTFVRFANSPCEISIYIF